MGSARSDQQLINIRDLFRTVARLGGFSALQIHNVPSRLSRQYQPPFQIAGNAPLNSHRFAGIGALRHLHQILINARKLITAATSQPLII